MIISIAHQMRLSHDDGSSPVQSHGGKDKILRRFGHRDEDEKHYEHRREMGLPRDDEGQENRLHGRAILVTCR
jgi:hypothetical protein